jgi:hypothetical protein
MAQDSTRGLAEYRASRKVWIEHHRRTNNLRAATNAYKLLTQSKISYLKVRHR